jgi:hypothetical protein
VPKVVVEDLAFVLSNEEARVTRRLFEGVKVGHEMVSLVARKGVRAVLGISCHLEDIF